MTLLRILQLCCIHHVIIGARGGNEEFELHPQDGWFNNLIHPDWGAIDGQLLRKSPVAYSDGVYMPSGQDRPNPFEISRAGHKGPPGLGSLRNRTAFLVFFGQQVVEEILDAQTPGCPREFFNIPVKSSVTPQFDPENKGNVEMPVFRSRYDQRTGLSPNNPRQQLNEITPYIDGTLMYGPGKAWTDAIRELSETHKGRLKGLDPSVPVKDSFPALNDLLLPFANPPPPREHNMKPVKRFWMIGNPRGNENPFLLAFGILWFRYHNHVADEISKKYPALNDEQVFNLARKKVIATHQNIVLYEWLPMWLQVNSSMVLSQVVPPYSGYNPNIHPGIAQEFQSAAFRFGHTLVTPGTWIRKANDPTCTFEKLNIEMGGGTSGQAHALRLCNAFWNPQEFLDGKKASIDNLLSGLAVTLAEREDHIVVPDLREHLFGPLEFSRRDLIAINIQRARDHGLPDYNSVREAYGLERRKSWEDINTYNISEKDPQYNDTENMYPNGMYMSGPIANLKKLYGNTSAPDNLDLFSGGLLETTPDGLGELFRTIIRDQFTRIRDGDRFWFENENNGLFNRSEIEEIRNISIRDVVLLVTNIKSEHFNKNPFIFQTGDPCPQPQQLRADTYDTLKNSGIAVIEQCTGVKHYDYFSGSEYSFALSYLALGLCIPGTVGMMILMAKHKQRSMAEQRRKEAPKRKSMEPNVYIASEWMDPQEGERNVKVKFDIERKKIHVTDRGRRPLRMIDLRYGNKKVHFRVCEPSNFISVRVPDEIDLVLRFATGEFLTEFIQKLEEFLRTLKLEHDRQDLTEPLIMKNAYTKAMRKKTLDKFLRAVCLEAFKTGTDIADIRKIQLTRTEFAEALGLTPNSLFVRNMFLMVDKDKNGLVSFHEFMTMFNILAKGNAGEKAEMFFNMFDLKRRGYLSHDQLSNMIKSMLDLSDTGLDDGDFKVLVDSLYQKAGLQPSKNITIVEFKKIFASGEYEHTLEQATLQLIGAKQQWHGKGLGVEQSFSIRRKTFIEAFSKSAASDGGAPRLQRQTSHLRVKVKKSRPPPTGFWNHWNSFTKYVENYRRQIFWVSLYILITVGIFAERAFYYSFEREHFGLRRLAGYGVSVTRGAASGMMWTFSCLLLTMSRNTITFLRETFLHRFIPFDSFHAFHKLIAYMALIFTVMHVFGHGINLYHISTWASGDLNCVFGEYFRATDKLASFHYWAWTTITGLTGIALTLIVIVMYVFATPYARRNLFSAFWTTHLLYICLYGFMLIHGSGRLVQAPLTQNFLYGPLFVYVVDKLISISRKKVEIAVKKAELLPSDVLGLTFKRPSNFEYKSGQWVRIACQELGTSEYHPFTLTSAPNEEHLSLHIRAVGPWTMNMRKTYDANTRDDKPFPKLYLDGPFGEGHQDWYRYKVSVLVGGGIGVTPFASILKDIVFKSRTSAVRFPCEKVYFLWVTRTQKQFEWLTDIIREVENNDPNNLVNVHIFITQFQQKFDLRTTMLYLCERHFQKVCGKSLFTGLKATTHFGRPEFEAIFKSIHHEHPKVQQVGVFSCGPPPMTLNVEHACAAMNTYTDFPSYIHHFENF
ncbi:dual oxidase 2-like isoform X1 [Dreissena polymorpha]|nr:dual oxidase 2-like isoform X1 [Dreissena polymorpha]